EQRAGARRKLAAEVGTHEEALPIGGGAREREHRRGERGEGGGGARAGEGRMHGGARAGLGKAKGGQRGGRGGRAGEREPEARAGEGEQPRPCIGESERIARHGGTSARKVPGNSRGRMRSRASSRPCRPSQASNSGAGRLPKRSRIASASWNEV